ncbi:MAG: replicative DNA helicase [Betaproteobacteria bacterium]|nr:replicative DNA helicase [Betaproteobacteria bacterium]
MLAEQMKIIPPPRVESPHAFPAEQGVLGAVLQNNELLAELDGIIGVEHFYDSRHKKLFQFIQKLAAEKHADFVLLAQELKNAGALKEAGGNEYIADIMALAAAPINIRAYAEQIKKAAQMRSILSVLNTAHAQTAEGGKGPQEILDETEALLNEIGADGDFATGMTSAAEKAREFFDHLTDIVNKKEFDRLLGLKTGYPTLNKMTTGLHGGDLVVIAGRPGAGKTAFALNIVRHVSATGAGVVVFSLEMSDQHLVMRLISQEKLDMHKLRTGKDRAGRGMGTEDLRIFSAAVSHLQNRQIYIDDGGILNVLEAKSRTRRAARRMERDGVKLSLVVVDYLQLLSATPGEDNSNRAQVVATISRGLKALAKELNVPVLALSQLNRGIESRTVKEPLLSDLRESGAIEQDADIVLFLHEEKTEERDYASPSDEGTPVKLIIGKQRNGPVGMIPMQFQKQYSRFAEAARGADDDF